MGLFNIDKQFIRGLIKADEIENLLKLVDGIDPKLTLTLKNQTDAFISESVDRFKNFRGTLGELTIKVLTAFWHTLWIVIKPFLPSFFNFLGQLDAIRQISGQRAFKELRPTPSPVDAVINFIHRMPEEQEDAVENLRLQGYNEQRIRQILIAGRKTIDENTIRTLKNREIISVEEASSLLQKAGYNESGSSQTLKSWPVLLDVNSIRDLFLRNKISESEVRSKLAGLGFDDINIEQIKVLFYQIPSAQDLIVMSVREVFSPEIASRFGQYEDFPEEFAEHAETIGISRDWAERYWAAHWDLPSIDRKSTRLNSSHTDISRMPSSA